jgi:predicted alpha/beta-hydrolase family hydrolase
MFFQSASGLSMKPHIILSHGLDSSPEATKVTALAAVAEQLGFSHERPDYSDIDADGQVQDIDRRIARLHERARAAQGPLLLVGSSMGAFISGLVSLQVPVQGLLLMAPPIRIEGYPRAFDAAAVPTLAIHGWHDELIPAAEVVAWAQARNAELRLVNDSHRLNAHVDYVAQAFAQFLRAL